MENLTLHITGLAHDGRGIGFLPGEGRRGMAVFVAHALPGQTVRCQLRHRAKNFLTADLRQVLSSDFTPEAPLCPHSLCGGCPLSPLPYASQLQWKEKLLLDALERIGKLPRERILAAWAATSPSPGVRGFRNKITLAFGADDQGQFALGFRQRGSHVLARVSNCALVAPEAMSIAKAVGEAASSLVARGATPFGFWQSLTLRRSCDNGRWNWRALLLTERVEKRTVATLGEKLMGDLPSLGGIVHMAGSKVCLALGEDARILTLPLGGRLFRLPLTSFFQVNDGSAENLAAAVKRMAGDGGDQLLDLYCGVGAPGQLLAERFASALGIERDAQAIAWARRNAADLPGWQYRSGDAAQPAALKCKPHTVLVDPPRSGLGTHVAQNLLQMAPEQIIYISCDAATLARDAARLGCDYHLARLELVDMFPHTPHREICTLWRKGAKKAG